MLLIPREVGYPSPAILFPSIQESAPVESPNVNAFKAPAMIPTHTIFNLIYDDGADLDGEVRPFFDALEGKDEFDSDDDIKLEHWEPEPLPEPPEPPAQTGTIQEITMQMTEQQPMLLSNSELRAELRKQNISASWNKTILVHRLLTAMTLSPSQLLPDLLLLQNTNEAPPMEATGNPPPAGEMTEQQLTLLNNAALRDLLNQWNQSTNGNKQVLIQRLLSGESR